MRYHWDMETQYQINQVDLQIVQNDLLLSLLYSSLLIARRQEGVRFM